MNAPRPDDLLELDLSAASTQYAAMTAPAAAVWPRATVRLVNGWWAVKVWQSPGVPARRQSMLLAGQYSDRAKAFSYAIQEVGVLRFTARKTATVADWVHATATNVGLPPKGEPPC